MPSRRLIEQMLDETVVFVLAGGTGERLMPLTHHRSKPEVVFGGKYRIIDFVLANCMHSGLGRIVVVPQYKHFTLGKHLSLGWSVFNPEKGEYLMFCPPQKGVSEGWWEGTADSIYHNLPIVAEDNPKYILIASGDAVYQADFRPVLQAHIEADAELTIMALPVDREIATARLGVLEIDETQQVVGFAEKPDNPKPIPGQLDFALSSMGIYIFNSSILVQELEKDIVNPNSEHDFGKDVIPKMVREKRRVFAYIFEDVEGQPKYWRDIGAIDAYYEANMDLLRPLPPFDLYNDPWFWRTRQKQLPSTKYTASAEISRGTIIGDGCVIDNCKIVHSIISPKVKIGRDVEIIDSIVMDGAIIGNGSKIHRAILDRHCVIPDNSVISAGTMNPEIYKIIDNIVVIPEIRQPWKGR